MMLGFFVFDVLVKNHERIDTTSTGGFLLNADNRRHFAFFIPTKMASTSGSVGADQ